MSHPYGRLVIGTVLAVLAITALVLWLGPSPAFEAARQVARQEALQAARSPLAGVSGPGATAVRVVTGRDLVEHARELDGQWVAFAGEAIGDVMRRGESAWLNVADTDYAIGVLLPAAAAAKVQTLGNYHWRGDQVRVVGVFRRADAGQGGDLDILATELTLLAPGQPRVDTRPAGRAFWAVGLSLVALTVFIAAQARARSHRAGTDPAGAGPEDVGGFNHGGY